MAEFLPTPESMFGELEHTRYIVTSTTKGPLLNRSYPLDYLRSDEISNHFTEGVRIDCHKAGKKSPRQAWAGLRRTQRARSVETLRNTSAMRERVYQAVVFILGPWRHRQASRARQSWAPGR